MRSRRGWGAALCVALALWLPQRAAAECPDALPVEHHEGGIGGTGHHPDDGGVGGTGRRPDPSEGGVGGTGQQPQGGVGGTGVLGRLREDNAGKARLCIAGYPLIATATTTLLAGSGGEHALGADRSALQAGVYAWAVGTLDGGQLYADHIEILETGAVSLQERIERRGVRNLVLEPARVEAGSGQLRAAGLELRAPADLVERGRSVGPVRIRARRDNGGFRATHLDVLPPRPTIDRGAPPRPEPGESPRPTPTPPEPARPEAAPPTPARPTPRPPRPPHGELAPPTRVGPDRPARPETPLRPERPPRPERPHRPDLPPRPAIDRVGGFDG